MGTIFNTKYCVGTLCVFILSVYFCFASTQFSTNKNQIEDSNSDSFVIRPFLEKQPPRRNVIRIVTVLCPKSDDKKLREQLAVLMKSVAISSLVYKISEDIEFHFVLSNQEDEQYLRSKLKEYSHPKDKPKISLHIYSAADEVSKYYLSGMKAEQRYPCQYLRLFLPKILENTDAVIYFNTDTIVTGNIQNLWKNFYKMSKDQIIGLSPDTTADIPKSAIVFKGMPFVTPKGLNGGVQLMNLTRMREFRWSEKLLQVYHDYLVGKNLRLKSDQRITNILLHYYPGLFLPLPCQYNFGKTHCTSRHHCGTAPADLNGIQVLSGADNGFDKAEYFLDIFTAYRKFNFTGESSASQVVKKLMVPIRQKYVITSKAKYGDSSYKICDGYLEKNLFKDVFEYVDD